LNATNEWWRLYYNSVYDAVHIGHGSFGTVRTGTGPCAMLWLPNQTQSVTFIIGSYGIDTDLHLEPTLQDFRFVFFDYATKNNKEAKPDLHTQMLLKELSNFSFTDPSLKNWPLQQNQAKIRQVLASVSEDEEAATQYDHWGRELAAQLKLACSRSAGAILAEANAARTIGQWERGLHVLKLAEAAFAEAQKLLADLEAQRRKEKEPEMAEELRRQLDENRKKLASLKRQSEGKLDIASWLHVDFEVQALARPSRRRDWRLC